MKKTKAQKRFSNRQLTIMSIGLATIIILAFVIFSFLLQTHEAKFSLKAAIIDQLGNDIPNPDFNETGVVASILKDAGFNVSYHKSETVNVTFYKELAKNNYGLIILRSHSATRKNETIVDFFTSEEYSQSNYVSEQENGLLTIGYYLDKPEKSYFAIAPKFIESLEGYFPKSIVIAMGCNSLNATCTEMAEAFIKKSAKAYIGWTGSVYASHTDNETIRLLRGLLVENKTLSKATTPPAVKPDISGSIMTYYPSEAGDLHIFDLVKEAKISLAQTALKNCKPLPLICAMVLVNHKLRDIETALDRAGSITSLNALKQLHIVGCGELLLLD